MGLLKDVDKDNQQEQKPLVRKWFAVQRAKGIAQEDMKSKIVSIRLSSSEEWVIVETNECIALLSAESTTGHTFWDEAQLFNGKAKALVLVPARSKLGFDIEISEDETGYWHNIDGEVTFSKKKKLPQQGELEIKWEQMKVMTSVTPTPVDAS